MISTSIFSVWLTGLLSLGILGGGAYLAYRWYDEAWAYDLDLGRHVFDPNLGWNDETAILAAAVCSVACVVDRRGRDLRAWNEIIAPSSRRRT